MKQKKLFYKGEKFARIYENSIGKHYTYGMDPFSNEYHSLPKSYSEAYANKYNKSINKNRLIKHKNDYHIQFVSTRKLGDYAGMNPAAARVFGIPGIKRNDILIERIFKGSDRERTIKHEISEYEVMKHGWPYWKAHKFASGEENKPFKIIQSDLIKVLKLKHKRV